MTPNMLCNHLQIKKMGNYHYSHPCGQCIGCRINKQRQWATRILLEAMCHDLSLFVTLTLNDDNIGDNTVSKKQLRNWVKRFRKAVAPRKIRFFGVGEYGDESGRAHYHAVIFNAQLSDEKIVRQTWTNPRTDTPLGYSTISLLTPTRAMYIAKYITKRLTSRDSSSDGRQREFATMSKKPGIGLGMAPYLAKTLKKNHAAIESFTSKHGPLQSETMKPPTNTINVSIRLQGKIWPLDQYMLKNIYELMGGTREIDKKWPQKLADRSLDIIYGDPLDQEAPRRAERLAVQRSALERRANRTRNRV